MSSLPWSRWLGGLLIALALCAGSQAQHAAATRIVLGKVLNHQDAPVPGAVVYLTNARSRAIRTYIVKEDGTYRFPGLASNTDYELYALRGDKRSDTKTVSQFDDREQVNLNLKIDTR
ncbi:MAG: carboxypeptidase regulatory-like domain-containing protein [Acidobacteriales bacterium]|nr:carboxypeptidase regulatory-like domain-containing protein [Terriglobales bacterium]